MRTFLLFVFLLLSSHVILAQGSDAIATLSTDKNKLLVGDQARIELKVQHDPNQSRIIWPAIPDSFGKLEVVTKDKIDTVKNGQFTYYKQLLLVAGFDSGVFTVPVFQVMVEPKNGSPYPIQTDSVQLLVQTVVVDTNKAFMPIKGIMNVQTNWLDYLAWIIAGLLALVAIGLIIYFTRQKKHAIPPPPPPPEPLHVRVLRALDELEQQQLWQKGEIKAYYSHLTAILRSYIEARFGIPAMERTTDELTGMARRNSELAPFAEKIYSILFTADFAKFARAEPLPAEHLAAMQSTRDFVTATIPAPVAPITPAAQP